MKLKKILNRGMPFVMALGMLLVLGFNQTLKAEVIKWRFHSHLPASSASYTDSVLRVVELVKERTNGRLVLVPYTANSLVPSKEIFNAVKRGMLQMGGTSANYIRAQVPAVGIASGLPFSFKDPSQAAYFIKRLGYEKAIKDIILKRHGLYYFTDRAYPTELVLKKPVTTFDDFQGLKLRSSGAIQKFLTAAGSAASYITGGEVYSSLSTGVVDGAHWGAAAGANSMNFYDICKYHLKPALTVAGTDIFLINQKAFEALPADLQGTLLQTMELHFWERTNKYEYQELITLANAQKEKGVKVITLTADAQKKLTKVAMQIWEEEAKTDPLYAKWIGEMKNYLNDLGQL